MITPKTVKIKKGKGTNSKIINVHRIMVALSLNVNEMKYNAKMIVSLEYAAFQPVVANFSRFF